jgi:hypothetical protein
MQRIKNEVADGTWVPHRAPLANQRAAFDTYLDALRLQGQDAAIHLEDDIILTRDFLAKAGAVIAERPSAMIQFFSMRKADLTDGSRWDRAFLSNLCTYIPTRVAPQLVRFGARWPGRSADPGGYDLMVRDWLATWRLRYWATPTGDE